MVHSFLSHESEAFRNEAPYWIPNNDHKLLIRIASFDVLGTYSGVEALWSTFHHNFIHTDIWKLLHIPIMSFSTQLVTGADMIKGSLTETE